MFDKIDNTFFIFVFHCVVRTVAIAESPAQVFRAEHGVVHRELGLALPRAAQALVALRLEERRNLWQPRQRRRLSDVVQVVLELLPPLVEELSVGAKHAVRLWGQLGQRRANGL